MVPQRDLEKTFELSLLSFILAVTRVFVFTEPPSGILTAGFNWGHIDGTIEKFDPENIEVAVGMFLSAGLDAEIHLG